LIAHSVIALNFNDGPKHLAVVAAAGVSGISYDVALCHTSSSPGAPPIARFENEGFVLFLNILQHAGIIGWPSKDFKLLWSMRGKIKF